MIWMIPLLLIAGVLLSAIFSGSETGFYRVTRTRLLLDALGGDRISRGLLWLTNNPALFVSTTLVGNNLANYCLSFGIVMAVQQVFAADGPAPLVAPMILSPIVFIYCELLPKQLFFQAPNRLLRRVGPMVLLVTVGFAPLAALLWLFGRALESLVGQTPLRVRSRLARKELQQVLQEGQEVGILTQAQHELAQRLFSHTSQSVMRFSTPLVRATAVPLGTDCRKVLRLARRRQTSIVPVRAAKGRELVGYVRVIDLRLQEGERVEQVSPLPHVSREASHLEALIAMHAQSADVACIDDADGRSVALLYAENLTSPLFDDV